jgi:hypothetical protein
MSRVLHSVAFLPILAMALVAAGLAAAASQPQPTDDVPPFVGARGEVPLNFAVTGLSRGFAEVGPGARMFAVCWQGGDAPYTVSLRNAAGQTLVLEKGLSGTELILASKPVAFTAGAYDIDVSDAQGAHADGRFTVVAAAMLPPGGDATGPAAVTAAEAADRAGAQYRYEAYLRVAPAAIGAPGSAADQLARTLCHRQ